MDNGKLILVTGGSGFIGSNFIKYILNTQSNIQIINLDKLTYAGNPENLKDIENDTRYEFIKGDICDEELVAKIFSDNNIDSVINFAAETHVDRSVLGPLVFSQTNILGTQTLLEAARKYNAGLFLQHS